MPDFRVADTAPEHRKLRAAGLAAAGLWALAGGYAMRELTDGWVPDYWVQTWPAGRRHAATLIKVGLWRREKRDGIDGYVFHDWFDIQRSAAQIAGERERSRERAAKSRRSHSARAPNVRRTDSARHGERAADVRSKSHDSLSLSLPPGGHLGGESSGRQREALRDGPPTQPLTCENGTAELSTTAVGQRPPQRCERHRDRPADGPCRACGEAAAAAQKFDRDAERGRIQAVRNCRWCDAEGDRIDPANRQRGPLGLRCDHTPMSVEQLEELAP
jgi:hypothetical protein